MINEIIELNKLCSLIYFAECFQLCDNETEFTEIKNNLIIYHDE